MEMFPYPEKIETTEEAVHLVSRLLTAMNPRPEKMRAFPPGTFAEQDASEVPVPEEYRRRAKVQHVSQKIHNWLQVRDLLQQVDDLQLVSEDGYIAYLWGSRVTRVGPDAMDELAARMAAPPDCWQDVPGGLIRVHDTVRYDGEMDPGWPDHGIVESIEDDGSGHAVACVRFGPDHSYMTLLVSELILVRPVLRLHADVDH